MKTFLNELSLDGQFCNQEDFENQIRKISEILWYFQKYNVITYTSFYLWKKMALRKNNLRQSLFMIRDREIRSLFRRLIDKGPFWEDEKIHRIESLYYYGNQKITGFTPAEAAERIYSKQEQCSLISFEGAMKLNFNEKECEIIRKIGDNIDKKIIVFNITNKLHAGEWYDSNIESNNWEDFFNKTTLRCSNLRFLDKIKRDLRSINHSPKLAEAFLRELIKLNDVVFQLINKEDSDSKSLKEYMQEAGLCVSDESESTKSNRKLKEERTYLLPDGRKKEFTLHVKKIKHKDQCPRIHFFIEKVNNSSIIWIGYIGKHLPTFSRKK